MYASIHKPSCRQEVNKMSLNKTFTYQLKIQKYNCSMTEFDHFQGIFMARRVTVCAGAILKEFEKMHPLVR